MRSSSVWGGDCSPRRMKEAAEEERQQGLMNPVQGCLQIRNNPTKSQSGNARVWVPRSRFGHGQDWRGDEDERCQSDALLLFSAALIKGLCTGPVLFSFSLFALRMSRASTFPTGAVDCSSRPAIRETLKAMLALVHPLPSPADHRNVDRPLEINISGLASIPTRAPKPSHRKHSLHYQPESSSAPRTPSASSTVACHSYPARPNAVQSQHPANHQPAYFPPKRPHPSDKQSPRAPQQPASQQTTETVDIHSYAPADLLRLLASLLTQIASTNDALASTDPAHTLSAFSHPISPENTAHTPLWCSLTSASRSSLANPASTLAFHARNIPTIPLEAYLLRILRYCPTTNEVFLALLVYFDRMSRLAHDATGRTFVIDSYNVHRLIIAGVTVASKFFSDVFYTNSRYAKVSLVTDD